MTHTKLTLGAATLAASLAATSGSLHGGVEYVEPIEAGQGFQSAFVHLEFFDGDAHLFEVYFDGAETSGFDLLVTLDEEPGLDFELEFETFPFGNLVTGLGYDGQFESGDGSGGDDFWHYWTRETVDESWSQPMVGPGDRIVDDGTWDGWVFGRDDAPTPLIPAPGALVLLGAGLMVGGRRRRAAA